MATEQVKQSINMFAGGMDLDSSDQTLQAGKYRLSKNLRFVADGDSNEGSLTLILGLGKELFDPEDCVMWAGTIGKLGIFILDLKGLWSIVTCDQDGKKTTVFGPCNEKLGDKLSVVTSDENDNIKKIYIADGEHSLAVVNVCKKYNSGDYELITTTPKIDLRPIKFAGYCDGGIKSGMVQYAYRLVDKYIRFSTVSPFTGLIPVGNFYKDQKNNKYDTKCCGVKLYIPNLENTGYSHVRLYRIYQKSIETQPVVYQLLDVRVSKDFYYSDQDDSQVVDELQVEELYDNVNIIPTVIESKNNRLFAANIKKLEAEDLFEDWDARAYLVDKNRNCKIYDYVDRSEEKSISFPIDWKIPQIPDINKDFDCFNPINDINNPYLQNDACVYDAHLFYGGTGKNVSWNFITTDLDFTSDEDQKFPFINMNKRETEIGKFKKYYIRYGGKKENIEDKDGNIEFELNGVVQTGKQYGGLSYKNPLISYALKSLRRDELYRYGIILYDERGSKSRVKWIADIRIPPAYVPGFETFTCSKYKATVHPIGIEFRVNNLPTTCNKYEIVRCRVRGEDVATLTQGIISRPVLKMDKDDSNEYFSSGMYTVAPYVTSSTDCFQNELAEENYHTGWGFSNTNYRNSTFVGMTSTLDKSTLLVWNSISDGSVNDSTLKTHQYEASNVLNKLLYCLASPEITFYPESFKSQLQNIQSIQLLHYLTPVAQSNDARSVDMAHYDKNTNIDHRKLGPVGSTITDDDSEYNYDAYWKYLPLGLMLKYDALKSYSANNLVDSKYFVFRDSPLLTTGSRYGMVTLSESPTTNKHLLLPYVIDNNAENHISGSLLSSARTPYIETSGNHTGGCTFCTYKIRCNENIITPNTSNLTTQWINEISGSSDSTTVSNQEMQKIINNRFKYSDKYVATSFSYVKLLDRHQSINTQSYIPEEGGTAYDDSETGTTSLPLTYEIQNQRIANVHNQTVVASTDLSEYVGTYKYTNFVLNGNGESKRTINAHHAAVSPIGLLRGCLPSQGFLPVSDGDDFEFIRRDQKALRGRTVTGLAGECLVFVTKSDDTIMSKTKGYSDALQTKAGYGLSAMGTYLTNVRKNNVVPYGGHGQNNISACTYNSYGDVFYKKDNESYSDAIVFDGNCYISAFEYCSMYKYAGDTNENLLWKDNQKLKYNGGYLTQSIYYCFPVETTMNLNLQYGNSVSEQVYEALKDIGQDTESDDIYFNALLPTMTQFKADMLNMHDTVYSHDRDHYMFNNSYQNDNSAGLHQAKDTLTTEEIVEFNRCYYSQEKQPLDILDGFLHFLAANYIDVDNRYGEITYLKEFKNQLLFWQTEAFGVFSVNERVQVNTPNSQTLQLGTGGVLDRYDYYSNFYGMRKNDHAAVTSAAQLYFWDANKKTLLNYYGGNLSNMNLTNKVSSYFDKIEVSDQPRQFYDRDNNEVLFLVSTKDENVVFNETIGQFTSIYTFAYDHSVSFPNEQYLIDRYGKIKKWNDCLNNEAVSWDGEFTPYVQFVVNGEAQANKVFDNQEICGSISDRDLAFRYTTPLKQEGNATQEDLTNREMDYKLAVPRDNNVTYGGRLRGKTMVVEISSTSNKTDFSLDYVITKFRRSLT